MRVTTLHVWIDPRGGTHSAAGDEGFARLWLRFRTPPDRVSVTVDHDDGRRETFDYRRPADGPLAPDGP